MTLPRKNQTVINRLRKFSRNEEKLLKRFLYLNTSDLNDYISALEGGLRGSGQRRTTTGSSLGGEANLKVAKGNKESKQEEEESYNFSDTEQARFERLLELASADSEKTGWVEALDPDSHLANIGIGALIEIECEIYVPDEVRLLSSSGGLTEALDTLDAMTPFAAALGLDTTSGLPSKKERDAAKGFISTMKTDLVVVGERDDSDWKVAGQVSPEFTRGDIDGVARIVGKVSSKWGEGEWKPLLALPGSSLMPRKERRALAKKRPKDGEEDQFMQGPALMLDVLAIYR